MSPFKILLAIIISSLALVFAIDLHIFFLFAIFLLIIILPFSLFNRKILFFVILIPFFLLPQLNRYHVLPILSWNIALYIICLLTIFIFAKIRLDNSYNFLFLFFLAFIFFEAFRGWSYGYTTRYVFGETIKYLLYPVGFYFTYSILNDDKGDEKFLHDMLIIFIAFGLIISFQILYYYFTITLGNRVVTRQANLLIISFISAVAYMLYYSKKIISKFLLIISMVIYLLSTIIMMQRSLWIGFIISILLFVFLYQLKFEKRKIKSLIMLLIILLVILGSYNLFQTIALDQSVLEERTEVFEQKEKTFSIEVRILSYFHALRLFSQNPIIGKGMGHSIITPYLNRREIGIVDNSYLVILWKLGIIGILIFSIIYIKFISQLINIINKTKYKINRLFGIIIFSIIIGQMINGLACVVMTLYYFNIIWGVFIAITDYLYRKEFIFNE